MKKIALLNSAYEGGKTLLNYLTLIDKNLQQLNYQFDFFQPDENFCKLTIAESEKILKHKVLSLPRDFTNNNLFFTLNAENLQNYDVIITNAAYTGRLLNENILCVATNHGTAVMPLRNVLQNADALTFADVILCYSKSSLKFVANCLNTLRKTYFYTQNKRIANRKTYLVPTFPLKLDIQNFAKTNSENNNQNLVEKYQNNNLVIGLLPTQPEIIPAEISLFNSIDKLLNSLLLNFPLSKIILRPYLFNPTTTPKIFELLNTFSANIKNFEMDYSGQSSTDFYQQCDILITDGSTGGVSFLQHKMMPPIYFIPREFTQINLEIQNFVNLQKDKVLFAHSIKQLLKQIEFCINTTENERLPYFENAKNDLFLNVDNKQVLQKIINGDFENFPFVDEKGNFFER